MKKFEIVFFVLIFLSPFSEVFAQKVGFNSNLVSIDRIDWLKFSSASSGDGDLSLLNDESLPLISIRFMKTISVDLQSETNPEGILYYATITFLPLNKEFEIQEDKEGVLRVLFQANVVTITKELDAIAVATLMKKHTQLFSKK
jgi:hypothetical protein